MSGCSDRDVGTDPKDEAGDTVGGVYCCSRGDDTVDGPEGSHSCEAAGGATVMGRATEVKTTVASLLVSSRG